MRFKPIITYNSTSVSICIENQKICYSIFLWISKILMTIKMFMSHFYEKMSIKILTSMNTYEKYKKFKWLNKYWMFSYKEKKS